MLQWLWLVPALPFVGFLLISMAGGWLRPIGIALVAAGSVGLSAVVAGLVAYEFLIATPPGGAFQQVLWTWMAVDGLAPEISLHLDALSLVMMLVITGVGFLIHVYATGYMAGDEGYRRFFAYMTLFVTFMLILALAGDLLLLFVGWEGVGLCSYLLIGFWYRDADNGRAARKAFIVTRIGDAAFVAGLLILFTQLQTTNIADLLDRAVSEWPPEGTLAVAAAALLLGGAVGKSAQLPLQVWLPDAMAGPTPVSALIHAATMVTAGVYLIARMLPLFELAPGVLAWVGAIGALTLLLGALAALAQQDIKRILAYSTISQIGYMFLALGVGAVSAALFHLVTHAFFKALLFLTAGAVILGLHGEHDIRRMGGLRKSRPVTFACFLIGVASLAALPLVTAGFYSKALVLDAAWAAGGAGRLLWLAGAAGAFVTALYAFRVLFLVFFGTRRSESAGPEPRLGPVMGVPMVVLAILAVVGGWIQVPALLATFDVPHASAGHLFPELATVALGLLGVYFAYRYFGLGQDRHLPSALDRPTRSGFGFDALYHALLTRPWLWLARITRRDPSDLPFAGLARSARLAYQLLSASQTGALGWYAAATVLGAALLVGGLVLMEMP
jgi:NADH-quinone oxidoreductase subunit L